jgi:16S rRNA (cytosine1402-N4)-methyltransferase
MSEYHEAVMLREAIDGLNIRPDGIYVDVTFGGGGHSKAILEHLTTGKLIAFDQDEDAEANRIESEQFELVKQNFKHLQRFLRILKTYPVQGILADLGVSSHQIDTGERGFSTRFDARLDMRMNKNDSLDAFTVINKYPEHELQRVFSEYGEIRNARSLAKAIIVSRSNRPIATTGQLIAVAEPLIRGKRNQYLSKLFQAIRIEVNRELDALKDLLQQSAEVLDKGGRLVVISYHSLEDRLVKHFMKNGRFDDELARDFYGHPVRPLKPLHAKPVLASEEEIKQNVRARSARMRIAEKI